MHKKIIASLFLGFVFITTPLQTFATKYYVNDGYNAANDIYCLVAGNNANNGISPTTPKATLANVLSTYGGSFTAGDTILIDSGNYSDKDLSSPINGVVIKGAGMNATTFTNPGSDNYFIRIDDNNTVLMDFKLTRYDDIGGATPGGQAIGVFSNKTGIQIINVQINDCRAGSALSGYPVEIASGANVKFNGGGLTCNRYTAGGGIRCTNATVEFKNYQFLGNSRDQSWASIGASLHINGGTVNIYNTRFEQNDATGDGVCPGLYINGGTVNVFDSKFDKNTSLLGYDAIGGTIYVLSGTVKITRSIISNHTQTGGSKTLCGGISVAGGTTAIDSCLFTGNKGKNVNDVYITNGNVNARNCTFNSVANQIQDNGTGTFTIADCGNPSETGSSVVRTNTNNPTYTANPSLPSYLNQTCVTVPCIVPTISSVASIDSICSGSTFISNIISSASPVIFSWTSSAQAGISGNTASGTGNIADLLTNSTSNSLTATYTITPYSGACTGASTNYVVTVLPKPIVVASANNYGTCNGSQATLNASGSGLTNYTWSPSNGLSSTNTSSVTTTVTNNIIYTVTASNANGCSNTDTVALTVNALPSVTGSTALYNVCKNSSITLQAIGTGGNIYSWTPSTGLSNTTGSSVTATVTGNITYTVYALGTNGCINSDTVTIRTRDIPNVIASASSTPICFNATATLTATGAQSYSWYPNQFISANTGNSVTANPTSNIIYTVSGTSSNGCSATDTVEIVILNNDDPEFTFSPFTQCLTGANPIPVVNTPGGIFSSPNGLVINSTTGEINLAASGVGNFTINYQTPLSNSCPSDTSFSFQITNGYIADFSYVPDTVCGAGNNISVVLGTNASHGLYTSYPSGLVFSNPSFGEIDPNASIPGTYTVVNTIAASGSCLEQKDSTTITILQTPNSSITSTPTQLCYGSLPIQLNPLVVGGQYTGNGITGNSFSSVLAGIGTHLITYTVDTLIGTKTCSDSTQFNITVNPLPDATFIGLSTPVCDGSVSQDLSANTPGGTFTGTGITGNNFDPSVSGAGTFDITYTVSNTFGCSDSTKQQITVNALPLVNNILTTNALAFCEGGNTYLIATSNNNNVSFTWNPGNILNDSLWVDTSGIYSVSVTDNNGCISDTQSTTVTVYPLPETPTIIAAGATNVCFGDSILLIANSPDAVDYNWYPYGGSNDSIYISALGTDTFFVTANSINKCISQSSDSIIVNVFPSASGPLLTAPNGNSACVGDSVLLIATSAGAYNYTWTPGGSNNDSIYISSIGNYNYSVSVSTSYNCSADSVSNSVNVSIYDKPADPVILSPNGLTACEGDSVMMVVNSTGANHYTWQPVAADNDTIYVTNVGTNSYTVSVSNSNNCGAINAAIPVNAIIHPAPGTPVLSLPNGPSACAGDSILIIATSSGASNYTWTPGGANNDSIYVSSIGTYNYQIEVSSNNNCAASTNSNTVSVTINPLVKIKANNDTIICKGNNLLLNATNGNTYSWYTLNSGATIVNPNLQTTAVQINNNVTIVVSDFSSLCAVNDTVYVRTFSTVTPLISATPTSGNDPLPVQFNLTNSSSFTSYYWNFNDGTANSSVSNPVHVYENGGTYYPTIYTTNINGCIDSIKIEIIVEPKFEVSLPNVFTPNGDNENDILYIKIRNGKLVYTEIYDRWGLMMYEQAGENVYWDGYTMGGQEASIGVYYYIITIEKFDGEIMKFTGAFSLFK